LPRLLESIHLAQNKDETTMDPFQDITY